MNEQRWHDLFGAIVEAIDRLTDEVKILNTGISGISTEIEFLNDTHIDLLNHFRGALDE